MLWLDEFSDRILLQNIETILSVIWEAHNNIQDEQ